MSVVTEVAAAPSHESLAHFEDSLRFETDCWDVHSVMGTPDQDFVLLDVRSPERFAVGHVPGAVNLPHRKIVAGKLAAYPAETVFITYCEGPHCNSAARAAIRLAKLGRPVKIMVGGRTGWLDEGYDLAVGDDQAQAAA